MKKLLSDLDNLSRLAPQSQFRSVTPPEKLNTLAAYAPGNLWAWTKNVGKYWFNKKHRFITYEDYSPSLSGVYAMPNSTLIGMAGDWGTGTMEAERVKYRIQSYQPDYTIHLGDTYYAGSAQEVSENFLGIKSSDLDPVEWSMGSKGTFVLLGNHEMYGNGNAYFDLLLPVLRQQASYFCLQNDHWRIIGLDTGYNSTGLDFWLFKPSCKLPDQVVTWLQTLNLKNADDHRGIILLSHHQPWSSFDTSFEKPVKQLAQLIDRPVLWFWGHEHRMAVYDRYTSNGLTGHGRCIGHGGMPVSLKKPDNSKVKCLFFDGRPYANTGNLNVGYNGFANLKFNNDALTIQYLDLYGGLVYAETLWPSSL